VELATRNAVLLGGLIMLLALLLVSIGLVTLILGIIDNSSAPLQLPGIVANHTMNNLDGFPRLIIRLHTAGYPATITPVVSKIAFHALHDGDFIFVDYTPHLHFPYALESSRNIYTLPGTSKSDNPIGSVALLLLGIVLFPYPALLTFWGVKDLQSKLDLKDERFMMTARVVGKRAMVSAQAGRRANRPGLTPRLPLSWYGIALVTDGQSSNQPVMTLSVSYEVYHSVKEGAQVQVNYSPHLHYVYSLEQVPD
jgi:hypothetical protein